MELRRAQHGLGEDSQEAQGFHEHGGVQEEVGDVGRHQREGQHALHVVQEVAPRPEVVPVKVYRRRREFLYFLQFSTKTHFMLSLISFPFQTEKEHNPFSLQHLFQLKNHFLLREATYNRRT